MASDPYIGDRVRFAITTSEEDEHPTDQLWHARRTLHNWLANGDAGGRWPEASHAAITLRLAARARESRATVLAAARSEQLISANGIPQPFLMLTAPSGLGCGPPPRGCPDHCRRARS